MVPDFATIRDTTKSKIKRAVYGFFAFGWTGSSKEWLRYEGLAFVLGGIAAVLVVSVHSIVSTDFAAGIEPGWHSTIFPPFFVVGAIFSGFAMVLTLVTLMKKLYKMDDFITANHVDAVCRILVFISLIMGTAYITEIFIAWYSGSEFEFFTFFRNRITGEYAYQFWFMFIFNALLPQLFWSKKIRHNIWIVFIISICINIGMWLERYIIIVTSLTKDFLPANWAEYHPTLVEIGFYIGTIGMFSAAVLLFFKYIPQIAIHEVKMVSKYNTQQLDHLKPGHHDYE